MMSSSSSPYYPPRSLSFCLSARSYSTQPITTFRNSSDGTYIFAVIVCHLTCDSINRLLFMIPVYAVSNLLAAIYYQNSIYFELVGNAYAAIGLASFFNLLYAYVTEGAQDPKQYFRRIKLKRWQWPLSWLRVKTPSQGLTWFNVCLKVLCGIIMHKLTSRQICYCGVFQYNFVLLANCIAGSLANVFNRYCPASLGPQHAYIWVSISPAIHESSHSFTFHRS